jgi:hypothetical protein
MMHKTVSTATALLGLAVAVGVVAAAAEDRPPRMDKRAMAEQMAGNAFARILAEVDLDRDGSLSMAECLGMWSDQGIAEQRCRFWDADGDETITREEYIAKAASLLK